MKTVKWIFSINADGVPPMGYAEIKTGQYVLGNAKNFQKELKSVLEPEIDLEFVSYNTKKPETPVADLIIYTDAGENFIDEETKKNAIKIPYDLFFEQDIEKIKAYIEANV